MEYLCLVYFEPKIWDGMSQQQIDILTEESLAYDEELGLSGHYITSRPLQPTNTAATVRLRSGKISQSDGPFAETKEVLGGFILIKARDLNEAIQVAGRIPLARYGSVEVRPILSPKVGESHDHDL